ncbi:MAG TPA: nickel-responsive transcriptional regulator NikR, partial [Thermoplasmatales archaeon]|nr:nickel-responsive transcriptional regulator NikR [Thermoplasmatales archaeon]
MGKVRISASIPADILKKFDEVCNKTGQPNRSNAIMTAMHDYIVNNRWIDKKGKVTGVVLLTYNHDVRGINAALTSVQHSYG